MPEQNLTSMELQGRRLAEAFARVEAPSAKPRRRGWRIAVAGGLAAIVITVMLAVGLKGSSEGPEKLLTINQAVAAVAKAAFDQPAYPLDKYLYISTRTQSLAGSGGIPVNGHRGKGFHYLDTFDQETWTKLGAPEARRTTSWPVKYLTPEDKAANDAVMEQVRKSRRPGQPASKYDDYNSKKHVCGRTSKKPATSKRSAVANDLGPIGIKPSSLPANPKQLYRHLKRLRESKKTRVGHNANDFVWIMAHALMQAGGPELKPAQRAALVGALAYLPDVRVLPGNTDPYGVPAVGFARTWLDRNEEVWFDTRTSMVSSMRQTQPKNEREMGGWIPAGSTVWAYRLLAYRFVDKAPAFPVAKTGNPTDLFFCR